jgi:hypothetical protein
MHVHIYICIYEPYIFVYVLVHASDIVEKAMGVSVPSILAPEVVVGLQELQANSDVLLAMGIHSHALKRRSCSGRVNIFLMSKIHHIVI